MTAIAPGAWREVALSDDEYIRIVDLLGREPSPVELGMFGAMWSEHCGYKHSRPLFPRLPTDAPWVIQGPGENAGAIAGYIAQAQESAPAAGGEFSEQAVWEALKTCFDPEIPVNIVDLGLIYDLDIAKTPAGGQSVEVKMTLTAPGCGVGPVIAEDARQKIAALPSVEHAKVHIVWDPQWTPQMISPAGRKILGLE